MAKTDITTTTLLPWDRYKDKPADEAMQSIYERASGTSTTICQWYWTSIKTKRKTSLGVRFLTFILLILGTVLPILAGLKGTPEVRLQFTQFGVAALALGGATTNRRPRIRLVKRLASLHHNRDCNGELDPKVRA